MMGKEIRKRNQNQIEKTSSNSSQEFLTERSGALMCAGALPASQTGCEIQDIKLNNADLITCITHH